MASVRRDEFELASIREFAHSGLHLGWGVSPVERRVRIREAIVREGKADLRWRDSLLTYAQEYWEVYQEPLGNFACDDKSSAPVAGVFMWNSMEDEAAEDDGHFAGDEEPLSC